MITTMSYAESLAYLDGLYHKPILPAAQVGLRRITYLLECLGHPERSFRSVHVAGSNGKGSTNAMMASILQAAGFRTGRFSSPHLDTLAERIAVDGALISPLEWERHWRGLGPLVEAMTEGSLPEYALGRPAYFEVLFAMMALHFSASEVEWAAVETGLGGRFDATNTLASDVAVITNISLEHTQVLGRTVREIAGEKAAIIKAGSHAVTAVEDPDPLAIIEASAARAGAPLLRVPGDVEVQVRSRDLEGQTLTLGSPAPPLEITLTSPPEYQTRNAGAAYAATLALRERGVDISDHAIARGFSCVELPGRFEVASRAPLIVLDGAHNPAAARELRQAIDELLPERELVLLFAAMADKDIRAMARALGPSPLRVVVTTVPGADRSATLDSTLAAFAGQGHQVTPEPEPTAAFHLALRAATGDNALVVTGSMYLVGYVRTKLAGMALAR
jgi:dihydrofolate synthase/folylpolyglutamate synthase